VHLLTAITPHGFGHAAQVAPVLNALRRRLPGVRLTLLTRLPPAFLRGRVQGDFDLVNEAPDFGLVMKSALDIDLDASAIAYRQLHCDWDTRLERETERLRRLAPDLVLADVPYLTLAAAAQAGIPALALCSLNWADIYRHYFAEQPEAPVVLAHMQAAYRSARAFLCPEPSMPMRFLDNCISIAPVAAVGRARPAALRARLPDSAAAKRVILVAPGGVDSRFPMEQWPADQGIHWLVSAHWQVRHPDVSSYQDTQLSFTDLVASCDAVLGKCGYGTVAECVANATPLMYIPRPDWPEEATLLNWLEKHRAALAVDSPRLESGRFADLLEPLASLQVVRCEPDGARQAAQRIAEYFKE
jgi:hypothetical protein